MNQHMFEMDGYLWMTSAPAFIHSLTYRFCNDFISFEMDYWIFMIQKQIHDFLMDKIKIQ